MARTEGTRSAASSAANTAVACSPSGSITDAPSCGRGAAVGLRATNDHHQELIRSNERDRRPRGYSGADDAMAQAVGDVRGQRRDNAQAEEPAR
jgi:hypothetical protein